MGRARGLPPRRATESLRLSQSYPSNLCRDKPCAPCVVELDQRSFLLPGSDAERRERRAREFASVARDEREPHTAMRQEENKSERITLLLLLTAGLPGSCKRIRGGSRQTADLQWRGRDDAEATISRSSRPAP